MHFFRKTLSSFIGVACATAVYGFAADASPCGNLGYRVIGREARPWPRPRFEAIRRDLPDVRDPVALAVGWEKRVRDWNHAHPDDLNNYSVPESAGAVRKALLVLYDISDREYASEIKRVTKLLSQVQQRGYRNRDLHLALEEAAEIVAKKFPAPQVVRESADETLQLTEHLPAEVQSRAERLWTKTQSVKNEVHAIPFSKASEFLEQSSSVRSVAAVNQFRTELLDEIGNFLRTTDGKRRLRELSLRRLKLTEELVALALKVDVKPVYGEPTISHKIAAVKKQLLQIEMLEKLGSEPTVSYRRHPRLIRDHFSTSGHLVDYDRVLESALSSEILIAGGRPKSIEGLADAGILGINGVEFTGKAVWTDHDAWFDSANLLRHDWIHAQENGVRLRELPLRERLEIQMAREAVEKGRRPLVARGLYWLTHERVAIGNFRYTKEFIQARYQAETGERLPLSEAEWLSQWMRENVVRRLKAWGAEKAAASH